MSLNELLSGLRVEFLTDMKISDTKKSLFQINDGLINIEKNSMLSLFLLSLRTEQV